MSTIISETNLVSWLENIRTALSSIRNNTQRNVAFINLDAFYNYVDDNIQSNNINFNKLISYVEPYIPLTLSDENLSLFLNAALSNDEYTLKALENSFVQASKTRFINAVYNAENEKDWEALVGLCKTIRDYKEQGYDDLIPN